MKVVMRRNQSDIPDDMKSEYVDALHVLKRDGTYDRYVQMHLDNQHEIHHGPAFLAWHREFLRRFEIELQRAANNPFLGLPYWDWALDGSPNSQIWSAAFMGPNGQGTDGKVTDGSFAYDKGNWPLNIRVNSEEPTPWLKRQFGLDPDARSLPTTDEVMSTLAATPFDVAPWNEESASGFRNGLEGFVPRNRLNMHNRVHAWVGGSMMPVTSPNEPAFWWHHCFVDKLWSDWQQLHPQEARYLPISGAAPGHNLNDAMPPWVTGTDTVTPAQVVDHRKLGYRFDTEDYLLPGEELSPFQWLWSADRGYILWLSNNGHVRLERDLGGGLIWDSGTRDPNLRAGKLIMQTDGNLVSCDPSNQVIWQSGTAGNPNSRLVVRETGGRGGVGSVALYKPGASSPFWWQPR